MEVCLLLLFSVYTVYLESNSSAANFGLRSAERRGSEEPSRMRTTCCEPRKSARQDN